MTATLPFPAVDMLLTTVVLVIGFSMGNAVLRYSKGLFVWTQAADGDQGVAAGHGVEEVEEDVSDSEDDDVSQMRKRKGKKLKGQHKIDNKRHEQSTSKAFFKDLL